MTLYDYLTTVYPLKFPVRVRSLGSGATSIPKGVYADVLGMEQCYINLLFDGKDKPDRIIILGTVSTDLEVIE